MVDHRRRQPQHTVVDLSQGLIHECAALCVTGSRYGGGSSQSPRAGTEVIGRYGAITKAAVDLGDAFGSAAAGSRAWVMSSTMSSTSSRQIESRTMPAPGRRAGGTGRWVS